MELIVLERGTLAKTNCYERPGKTVGTLQIGDSDLYVNDVLSSKPRDCCRTNVINTNRRVINYRSDTSCDLREVADPLRLIRDHHHRARLFCDIVVRHIPTQVSDDQVSVQAILGNPVGGGSRPGCSRIIPM